MPAADQLGGARVDDQLSRRGNEYPNHEFVQAGSRRRADIRPRRWSPPRERTSGGEHCRALADHATVLPHAHPPTAKPHPHCQPGNAPESSIRVGVFSRRHEPGWISLARRGGSWRLDASGLASSGEGLRPALRLACPGARPESEAGICAEADERAPRSGLVQFGESQQNHRTDRGWRHDDPAAQGMDLRVVRLGTASSSGRPTGR